ncbi:hypothetical protein AU476_12715 [Cupriavidus sp. UYMSc13B]|nr:hypothetical protein AU476_12715 [Cupriavidus sp. UYMSc13B]
MLDRPDMEVHITLVGLQLGKFRQTARSRRQGIHPDIITTPLEELVPEYSPARIVTGDAGKWLASAQPKPDLIVLFQPGIEAHPKSWTAALPELLKEGIPAAVYFYSHWDFLLDTWILQSYGYQVQGAEAKPNPLAVETEVSTTRGTWSSWMWLISASNLPPASATVAKAKLKALAPVRMALAREYDRIGDQVLDFIGKPLPIEMLGTARKRLQGLPNNLAVDLDTGRCGRRRAIGYASTSRKL